MFPTIWCQILFPYQPGSCSEMTGPDLFSIPFFSCCFGSALTELNETQITQGGGQGVEKQRWRRGMLCVWWGLSSDKPQLWHLNKCQGPGVRWLETMCDWNRGTGLILRSTDRPHPIRLQITCLIRLCFENRSPFTRQTWGKMWRYNSTNDIFMQFLLYRHLPFDYYECIRSYPSYFYGLWWVSQFKCWTICGWIQAFSGDFYGSFMFLCLLMWL